MSDTVQIVYVELLGEGTEVWRPARAKMTSAPNFYQLLPFDAGAAEEEWKFSPGTSVRCERRGANLYAVASESEVESK